MFIGSEKLIWLVLAPSESATEVVWIRALNSNGETRMYHSDAPPAQAITAVVAMSTVLLV
jgi:hypothetical protein